MNLFRALLTVSGFTLLSRVTGLVRETLIARAFGASQFTDAFYVAFRIPNLLRRLSAEGAFSQAFVPILAEFKNQQGHDPTKALVDAMSTVLAWGLAVLSLAGVAGASWVVFAVASGLKHDGQAYALAVHDDADHVPVHHLHLADDARLRRAQHVQAVLAARVRAGAAERRRSSSRPCSSRRT